jgi:hypothetical protein
MARWTVKLAGHDFDLRALSKLYAEPECRVAKDADGVYYLTRASYAAMEGFEVDQASHAWLSIANELMRVRSLGYEPVALDGVYEVDDDGTKRHYVFLSGIASGSSRAHAELTVGSADGKPRPDPEPAHAQAHLKLAEQGAKVREALTYWSRCTPGDADLCSYAYKVYEIIREDMAGGQSKSVGTDEMKQRGWATKAELDDFRAWANNRAISGERARHAGSQKIDQGVTPLSNGAALATVQRLLSQWLDLKVQQEA